MINFVLSESGAYLFQIGGLPRIVNIKLPLPSKVAYVKVTSSETASKIAISLNFFIW